MGNSIRNAREIKKELGLNDSRVDGLKTSAADVNFVYAPEGTANTAEITITMQDGSGNTVTGVQEVLVWLSDSSAGDGLTATSASGAVTVTTGTQLSALTAKKALLCLTNASGQLVITILDTSTTGFYPAVALPLNGIADVGAQLAAGDYN